MRSSLLSLARCSLVSCGVSFLNPHVKPAVNLKLSDTPVGSSSNDDDDNEYAMLVIVTKLYAYKMQFSLNFLIFRAEEALGRYGSNSIPRSHALQ